jgi:hypothetical protein
MPIDKIDESQFFECACHSDEHTLRFSFIPSDDPLDNEVYSSVFLNQYHSFFGRLWVAIKYLFGYKCKYGHFDCFILKDADVDRMVELMTKYKEHIDKVKKEHPIKVENIHKK